MNNKSRFWRSSNLFFLFRIPPKLNGWTSKLTLKNIFACFPLLSVPPLPPPTAIDAAVGWIVHVSERRCLIKIKKIGKKCVTAADIDGGIASGSYGAAGLPLLMASLVLMMAQMAWIYALQFHYRTHICNFGLASDQDKETSRGITSHTNTHVVRTRIT